MPETTKIVLMVLLMACGQYAQAKKNPFLTLRYDSVVIYDFDWRGKGQQLSIIDKSGKLVSAVKKSARLDAGTAKELSGLIGQKASYGQATAACFEPHLGIVYYRSGKPVAHITICMDCNRLYSSMEIPAQKQGKQGRWPNAYYIADGVSKSFRKYLSLLLKTHDFSHRGGESSLFD